MPRSHLFTHVIALSGALLFLWLKMPLPWLFGPILSCLIAALCGLQLSSVKLLGEGMRTILGVAVGATVTVAFFQSVPSMVATLAIIPVLTVVIGVLGVLYFRRCCGYDFATAYYASMPGGLQDMLAFGEEAGANVRTLSLIHASRVLVIVVSLPIVLTSLWHVDLTRAPGAPIRDFDAAQLALLVGCAVIGWQGAKRLGMFGASILGPLIMAALASMSGLLTTRPPSEAIWAAQYFIAIGIGVKYVGITMGEIRRDIMAGLGFCLVLAVLTIVTIECVLMMDLAPPIEAILSLTPGGQAELVVLSIIIGADMTFVVAHHLFRIFFVILGAPIVMRLMARMLRD